VKSINFFMDPPKKWSKNVIFKQKQDLHFYI